MKLITFEGIEGAGKSTQIKLLSDYLMSLGFTISAYREPGSSDSGEAVSYTHLTLPTICSV